MATTTISTTKAEAGPFWQSKQFGGLINGIAVYGLLSILSVMFLFPFFWQVTSALKEDFQIFVWPPQWIPDPVMWENFQLAFANPLLPFPQFFLNTMTLEFWIIAGRLISCVLIAYGFARLEAPGKDFIFSVLLATLMLPSIVTQIPRFLLFNQIGWVNSYLPLIVPTWFGEAYAIFLMRQFFMSIPRELEEAARIDGANTLGIILQIIVPLSTPVLSVITILSFKDIWNEFFTPLLYLNSIDKYTLAVGLAYFNGQFDVQLNLLMAASVVLMLPLIIVFFIGQKAFVEGISTTGLAGR
jgi:ABC-type glycerol-3-phosphate transport system permease component